MPASPPATAAITAAEAFAPRVVFFGLPRSGKSALIEAFVRTATTSPRTDVVPLAPAGEKQGVRGELVLHRIRVENPAVPAGGSFVIGDCDGQAAGDLLSHPDVFVRGQARGALAAAVRSADALVLVLDASADAAEETRTFESFHQFLDALQESRTFGREVGGLPVFLTLTKCDRLALPGDQPTDWMARVARRGEEVKARFEGYFGDHLTDGDASPFLPFGSLEVYLAATAVKAPAGPVFAQYADPDGTFGVARLVEVSLPAARAHRDRALAARSRLKWTVTGAGLLLATMLFGLIGLATGNGFGSADLLADRVRAYQRDEPPPAVRLSDRHIAKYRKELVAVRAAAGFDRLPDDLRGFVLQRLEEFDAYTVYRAKFQPPRLGPGEVRTREQVEQLDADLSGDLAPPPEYAAVWADTEAVRLWRKWQTDLVLVREAEAWLHDWYRGLIRRANQLLLTEKPPDYGWRGQVTTLFANADSPPVRPADEVEKSPAVPVLRGKKLTYAPVFAHERVDQARRDWADTRDRLTHLRDLTDALGMTVGPGTPAPVLDLPEPTADGSRDLAAARLAALRVAFPPAVYPDDTYPEWAAKGFPDPVRQAVEARLRNVFDTGTRHVRRMTAAAFGSTPEAPDRWQGLADGLLQEPALKAWGRLLGLLRRWADSSGPPGDPVQEFADFLRRDRFELSLKAVVVGIPDDLLEQRAMPSGRFVVTHTPAGGRPTELPFRLEGEGKRDRPLTQYTFAPDGHAGTFTYRPGDGLTASLPVRAGGQDYRLVWSAGRSTMYQIDRLAQSPVLEKVGPVPSAEPAPGVKLTAAPPGGLPAVPVLLPDLRAAR